MRISGGNPALRAAQTAYAQRAPQTGLAVEMLKQSLDLQKKQAEALSQGIEAKGRILDLRA